MFATPPVGRLCEVEDGRNIFMHCEGAGVPAVVIEAGAGAFGLDYHSLLELVAQRTTCVIYDRAGSG